MQTILVEIKRANALKVLEKLAASDDIIILNETGQGVSFALPGAAVANTAFIEAIKNAENDATLSFSEARNQWKKQKTRLQ